MKRWLVLGGLLLLSACAISPTGRQQFLMMGPRQLDAMGDQAFAELRTKRPVVSDPRLDGYVRCVAGALIAQLHTPYAWDVTVFRDPEPNAFALPGGHIGVNTGLLRVARNPDQLAAVIGHELGHTLAHHANERLSQQFAVQGGLMLLGATLGDPGAADSRQLMQALGLGAQLGILLPYSRLQESEADRIGLDLMARAGFDPRQSLELWRNMAREAGPTPPEFLSTHPAGATRMNELSRAMGGVLPIYRQALASGRRPRCG